MTPDRVMDLLIGHLEEVVKKHRVHATDSVLTLDQYAHACGYIQGVRKTIEVCTGIRRQYLSDGKPLEKVLSR